MKLNQGDAVGRLSGPDTGNRSAFRFPTPPKPLEFTGERYVSGLFGDIQSEHYHRYLFALRFCHDREVLDVASGEGYGAALIGQVARSVVGVDLDAASVRFSNDHYLTERVSFRRGDATALPISNASVDVVVSFETIEHLADHTTFLREVRRVLRPGGLLVLSSPDRRVYSEEPDQHNPFHLRELGRQEFLSLMRANFAHVALLEQRALTGAVIMRAPETGAGGTTEGFATGDGTLFVRSMGVPEAPYLLAVASDAELPPIPNSVMHTPRGIWHLEEMRQRAEKAAEEARSEHDLATAALEARLEQAAREHVALLRQWEEAAAERDLRGNEVDRRDTEIAALSRQMEKIAAECDLRGSEVDRRDAEIAALSRQIVEIGDALRQISGSTTWRLSRPVRDLLARHPALARLGRRSVRLLWWMLSGKLLPRAYQQLAWRREAREIAQSGTFDREWYLENNPDVTSIGMDPLWHYVTAGRAEGRAPAPPAGSIQALPLADSRSEGPSYESMAGQAEGCAPAPPAGSIQALPLVDGRNEWLSYESMARRIAEDRAQCLAEVRPRPIPVIEVAEAEMEAVTASLRFPAGERPTVSIVVPVFNNLRLTLECLLSVHRYTDTRVSFEVILADDASSDRTSELLPLVANATYLRNEENLGFLRNCNRAAERARGEFVLFLNNDVQVTEGWLFALVNAFRARPRVGAVGPRIVYPSGHLQEAGVLINPDCSAELIGLNDDPTLPRYGFARQVDYCSGACLMLERARFVALSGFNDDLAPAYCEDLDLCLRLRQQGLDIWYVPDSVIVHHLSRTANALGTDYKMRCIIENQQKIAERWQMDIDALNRVRLFAFYLPQFHPIPENDHWWGKGFTEWSNVARTVPQYAGHHQPQLPADLGFYDLRMPEVLAEQARLARRYGVEGFCFHYYWFAGQRLLERPLEAMLASGEPDFPFLLCWANENWTRRWDGMESEVLIAQQHSDADDAAVIRDLMRYFRDRRYVRVNGRPLLLIYRVGLFPDFGRTAATWRDLCRKEGVGEIYLAMVESFEAALTTSPAEFGCDATVQFPPHGHGVRCKRPDRVLNPQFSGGIFDYNASLLNYLRQPLPAAPRFSAVMPSWDNTARRMGQATIFDGASPAAFQAWLEAAIRQTREHNFGEERIVFVNAWNEWAEGAHLEPDRVFGHGYLEAVRNALAAHTLWRD